MAGTDDTDPQFQQWNQDTQNVQINQQPVSVANMDFFYIAKNTVDLYTWHIIEAVILCDIEHPHSFTGKVGSLTCH
jgi:hypothetical protein